MKGTIIALVAGVLLGSTGIAAATSHTASNAITYAGIRCVTARETAAVVCSRVTNTGYTASMSKGFITVSRNGGSYQLVFQRRNRWAFARTEFRSPDRATRRRS